MSIIGESDNRVARPTCAANNRGKTKKTRKVAPPIEIPTPLLPLPLDRVVLRQRRISSVKMAINLGRISLSLSLSATRGSSSLFIAASIVRREDSTGARSLIIKEHRLNVVARSVDSCWGGGGERDWSEYCSLLMRKETAKKRLGARRFNAFSREKGGRVAAHSSRDFASTDACPAQTFFDEPRRVSARTEPRLASPEYSLLSTHTRTRTRTRAQVRALPLFFLFFFYLYLYLHAHN